MHSGSPLEVLIASCGFGASPEPRIGVAPVRLRRPTARSYFRCSATLHPSFPARTMPDLTGLTQAHNPDDPSQTVTQVIPAAVDPTPFLPALLSTGPLTATKLTIIDIR